MDYTFDTEEGREHQPEVITETPTKAKERVNVRKTCSCSCLHPLCPSQDFDKILMKAKNNFSTPYSNAVRLRFFTKEERKRICKFEEQMFDSFTIDSNHRFLMDEPWDEVFPKDYPEHARNYWFRTVALPRIDMH